MKSLEERLRYPGLFSQEKTERDFINSYEYLKSERQMDGARLLLVVSSNSTKGSGTNWNIVLGKISLV